MSTQKARFVLVGPHKGKTMEVNGREFVDGVYEFEGHEHEIHNLTNLFSYYGAMPEGHAELHEALNGEPTSVGSNTNDPKVDDATVTLAEAIGQLDPDNDAHWTSNNLPSLEHLADVVGKKIARADVEAIAEGFTRAKAKALQA